MHYLLVTKNYISVMHFSFCSIFSQTFFRKCFMHNPQNKKKIKKLFQKFNILFYCYQQHSIFPFLISNYIEIFRCNGYQYIKVVWGTIEIGSIYKKKHSKTTCRLFSFVFKQEEINSVVFPAMEIYYMCY